MKTLAYLIFIAVCLAGTAFMGYFGFGDRPVGSPARRAQDRGPLAVAPAAAGGAASVVAASAAVPAAPATRPAAPPSPPPARPQPSVKPPAAGSAEVWDAIWDRLAAPHPGRMLIFPALSEQRRFDPALRRTSADGPIAPPRAEVRSKPISPEPPALVAVPVRSVDVPPLATPRDPERPPFPAMATGPKLKVDAPASVPDPALRVPLVTRPRADAVSLRSEPILDDRGGTAMPVLPVFRSTPVGPMQGSFEQHEAAPALPAPRMTPDTDAPAPSRSLVARPPMSAKPAK